MALFNYFGSTTVKQLLNKLKNQLSSYLKSSELDAAIDTALAEAKASGEFDGEPGKNGTSPTVAVSTITGGHRITITDLNGPKIVDVMDGGKGDTGRGIKTIARTSGNGAAGTTDTYTITYTDNSASTFTVYNGKNGINGTSVTVSNVSESSASGGTNTVTFSDGKKVNIKNGTDGSKGDKGDTPVRGTDYYTDADKAEWSEYIASELAKRGQLAPAYPEGETVDEALAWLAENGDQSKMYVLPDGFIYAWMLTEKEIEGGGGYTNILETYKPQINKRWSYSSKGLSTANGYMTIGPVPVKPEDVVRINHVYEIGNDTFFTRNYSRIHYLDSSGNYVSGTNDRAIYRDEKLTAEENATYWVVGYANATDNDPSTNTKMAGYDNITQMVVVVAPNDGVILTEADVAGYIMTINEEIKEGGGTEIVTEYAWANTGHAFVPADYEDRIIAVENKASSNTKRIIALEKSVENGGEGDASEAAALTRIKEWDKPVYDSAPVTLLEDSRIKPALTSSDRTISAIYAKYRALMAAHPNYITETNMGKSTASSTFTAVDMLRFDFKEPDGLTQPDMGASALHETKPTIIFLSGIHTEWVGVWGLYYALEEITTNPAFDDVRRNAHIVVIPCANPFCLTSQTAIEGWRMSHVNANGVAIHNNFGVDHSTSGSVGEYNYGGTAPYSEPETQYIDAVMAEYPNAVAFVSCHNNDYSTYYGSHVIWASSATYHMCNMTFRLVDKLTKAWLDKYGDTLKNAIDQYKINMDANDYRLGRATMSSSKGTEQKNATKYGIQGVNLEISRMMKVFSGSTDGTSEVMTHGAEVYANFMRTLLAAYDYNDKKDYAPNLPWKG